MTQEDEVSADPLMDVEEDTEPTNASATEDVEKRCACVTATAHEPHSPACSKPLYIQPSSHSKLKVFACSSNPILATEVAMLLGIQLGRSTIKQFADGEVRYVLWLHRDLKIS